VPIAPVVAPRGGVRGPLMALRLLQSLTISRRPHSLQRAAPLVRFLAPSALEEEEVHSPRVCLTRYVPPSGFLTLSTVYSLFDPPALFHAGGAHGVRPLQSFSLQPKPSRLSTRATSVESVFLPAGLAARPDSMLSWGSFLLRASRRRAWLRRLRRRSSHELLRGALPEACKQTNDCAIAPALRSITQHVGGHVGSHRVSTLSRFVTSSHFSKV